LVAEIFGPGVDFSCLLALQLTLNLAFPESAFDCHFPPSHWLISHFGPFSLKSESLLKPAMSGH
jgi:hypothetical protein